MFGYWEDIKNNATKMKSFFDAVMESIENMKTTDEKSYYKALFAIHKGIYGCHFNKCVAEKAVECMTNVNGTTGEHWTLDQTTALLKSNNLQLNEYDFYYTMNMLYSDFSNILGNDANVYVKMATAYINDPDADEGKVFRIWKSKFT